MNKICDIEVPNENYRGVTMINFCKSSEPRGIQVTTGKSTKLIILQQLTCTLVSKKMGSD